MVKYWLVLGSVAFGVGFSLSLPITGNVKDAVLVGLAAVPSAAAGAFVVSRQQKQSLQAEIQTLEQQRESLKQAIATLRDRPILPDERQNQLDAPFKDEQPVATEEKFEAPETAAEFRLTNPEHTRWLWEAVIVPRKQYPFLGSVCLPRYDTDEVWGTETILDLVGDNLRHLGTNYLEYDRLYERLDDVNKRNWLKVLTFAMSEYAYYMESENTFWRELCERLKLPYRGDSAEPISTLKELASEGIKLLKLPKAVGGLPIVSTLWLQSGIPYRNLSHFADLAADLAAELGWESLSNTDTKLLAQQLLDTCQDRYPGRSVLRRFLEYGCRPTAEPISGQLLQSVARVAIALREFNLQPQDVLLNPTQRQEFLADKVPQFQFFLRDWEALIPTLTIVR